MNQNTSDRELGGETGKLPLEGRKIESLDDIPREIADRRLHAEFGENISSEKADKIRENPDRMEKKEAFEESAKKAGMEQTEGVLGWSTDLESPAHVLKGEVPEEIATLVHEDLHRLTHPGTLHEMTGSAALRNLYEGITEYLAGNAVEGLHDYQSGRSYPQQVEAAKHLANEVGDDNLRAYFFKHEMADAVASAIDHLGLG